MTVKLWDWDAKWALKQTFEGHIHYVMQIAINPKDNNTFASASLDRTVKVTSEKSTAGPMLFSFSSLGHARLGVAIRIDASQFHSRRPRERCELRGLLLRRR